MCLYTDISLLLVSEHLNLSCYGLTLSTVLKGRDVTVSIVKVKIQGPTARAGNP